MKHKSAREQQRSNQDVIPGWNLLMGLFAIFLHLLYYIQFSLYGNTSHNIGSSRGKRVNEQGQSQGQASIDKVDTSDYRPELEVYQVAT